MSDGLTHTSLVRLLFAVLPCVLAAIAFDLHSSSLLPLLFTLACYRSLVLYHSAGSGGLTKADKEALQMLSLATDTLPSPDALVCFRLLCMYNLLHIQCTSVYVVR